MEIAGKKVLVTGGNGFIGSHLVRSLVSKNIQVIVPFIKIDKKSFFNREDLDKKTVFVGCDLRNYKKTFNLIAKNRIDFIYHLAAQSIVEKALDNPLETFESNIVGTINVLEAARRYGKVSGIIVTSSDKAYGKIPRASESNPVGGDHPYETSKSSADLISRTYFATYKLPVVVTRFGNVYGEGDLNFSRIIPGTLRAIIKGEKLMIRSNGKFVRDYVHVEDVVNALMVLSKNLKKVSGEAFNISSKENLSVIALIKKIEKALEVKINYQILDSAINEIPKQSIDFSKIRKLGWRPQKNINKTIRGIYEWYQSYFGK